MPDDIIRVSVGVAPESAAQIKSDLEAIAKGIKLEVQVDIKDKGKKIFDEDNIKKTKSDVAAIKAEMRNLMPKNALDVGTLSNKVQVWAQKNTKAASQYVDKLNEINSILSNPNITMGQYQDASKLFQNLKSSADAAGIAGQTAGEKFKGALGEFTRWFSVSRLIMEAVQATKQLISTNTDLSNSMNNIRMITGSSQAEADKMLESYKKLADQVSSTTSEVIASGDEWLRQGRTVEETNQLIKASQVFSKVGMLESSEAAELLTSSMNGYKVSVADAMGIVDKMSAIDVAAATSTQELAVAMAETATGASMMGISMDALLAYIGTVSSVTRDSAESIKRYVA